MKRLKDQINNKQLFEAYPIGWVGDDDVPAKNYPEMRTTLSKAVRELHKLSDGFQVKKEHQKKHSHFYEVIDREDLYDIKMFLTDVLWKLDRHRFLMIEKDESKL